MKIKKLMLGSLVAGMLFGGVLVSCDNGGGNNNKDAVKLTLWVSEATGVKELTQKQVEDFNKSNNAGITVDATIEQVSESNSATQMLTDVSAGADIYCFAQDQFNRLVQGGALSELASSVAETVKAENSAGSVKAVTLDGKLYAYPMTADNGYFLYYDKTVLSAEDVKDMDTLLTKLEAAKKNISFEMETSAWYIASYFFGAGCVSEWTTDAEGNWSVNDTFNSDKGLIAVKGMQRLVQSPSYVSSSETSSLSAAKPSAALVSGTWAYNDVLSVLGNNMGVAELPSFKVDGKSYHLGSFSGYKLMGVKPQTTSEKAKAAQLLAQYLTSEKCQLERFEATAWGPSNLKAQADPAVQANPALAALAKQDQYATTQGQIHGSWWDIAKVIGTAVKNATNEAGLRQALQDYEDAISALFSMSADEKNAWTVIGTIAGTKWDTDFEMTKDGDVWTSVDKFDLNEGDKFKVRQGKAWDVSVGNGGADYVVSAEEAGPQKTIKFNEKEEKIYIV